MRLVAGHEVQAAMAALVLGPRTIPEQLGDITLHSHQRDGADRALQLLRAFGGALIADDVGLGKTYLALAIAREFRNPLMVAPAATRAMWIAAAKRAGVGGTLISFDALARGGSSEKPDLVIVDEAHNLRNPATKRFAAARALSARSPVLLLSATPVQNRLADLRVIMSLFLGERAHALSADELAAMIVRREASDLALDASQLPAAAEPEWLRPEDDVDCLDRLLQLPPPIPVKDAGDGGVLLTYTMVRQWASSRAALANALRRRVARAHAIEDSLSAGRLPSRRELATWCFSEKAQQMAFTFMVAGPTRADAAALSETVRAHREATRACLDWIEATCDPDRSRADLLADIVRRHAGRRVIAFSEFAESVDALYRMLAPTHRVAMLTHSGGRTVGGHLSRGDILARFAPGTRASTPERERIDLLLTTDVLSEGVNLHDASVVVHIDLPWNPARLAQRVGRVRRIGSPESTVLVFAIAPPAPAERMLELESRLKAKLTVASAAIGRSESLLPGFAVGEDRSAAAVRGDLAATLAKWQLGSAPNGAVVGAVQSERHGFLAAVRINGRTKLIGGANAVTDDPIELAAIARSASSEDVLVDAREIAAVDAMIASWLDRHRTLDVVDLPERRVARTRRALLQRVEYISRHTPRHARPAAAPLLVAARGVAGAALSAGAERVLDELTHSSLSDTAWLQAIGEFASLHAQPREQGQGILALLLLLRPAVSGRI